MGVYSDDELGTQISGGGAEPPATEPGKTTDNLLKRLQNQSPPDPKDPPPQPSPSAEGSPEAEIPGDAAGGATVRGGGGGGATARPVVEAVDLSDVHSFYQLCEIAAMDNNNPPESFRKMFGALKATTKIMSTRRSEWSKDRQRVLEAFRENRVGIDGKIADPTTGEVIG